MEKKKEVIISNKIKCKKCEDIIESKNTNDYKRCSCGAVAVDGGANLNLHFCFLSFQFLLYIKVYLHTKESLKF